MVYYDKGTNEVWRIDRELRFVSYGTPLWLAVQKIKGVPALMPKATEEEIKGLIRVIFKVSRVWVEG